MVRKLFYFVSGILFLLILLFFIFRHPDKSLDHLKAIYTDQESEWMEIEEMPVHFKEEGEGPPIILLHGTGASLHTWDGWTEVLDDSLTVFRMDLPAFGLTGPHPKKDYTIGAYVRFVDAFAKAQQLDTFTLGGNSLGGYIAWAYTVEHPDKVNKLILVDAAGYPHEGTSTALAFQIASNPMLSPILKHITPKSFIRKNLEQVYADDTRITGELITRYHNMALRSGNRQAFIDRVHTQHSDISDRIPEIKCPTLIQWGSEDTWADPNDAVRFESDIKNAQLIIYKGLGHVPMEEDAQTTVRDVMSFILE